MNSLKHLSFNNYRQSNLVQRKEYQGEIKVMLFRIIIIILIVPKKMSAFAIIIITIIAIKKMRRNAILINEVMKRRAITSIEIIRCYYDKNSHQL
jgi:hypothetical protein